MDFKETTLWKASFVDSRADSTQDEQTALSNHYLAMRSRATALTAKIARDLPHMTVHDVTHLDALWEMASVACGDSFDLNPAEAFVFGGAVLMHDAAMTLAAFPGGLTELHEQIEWRDLNARYQNSVSPNDTASQKAAEELATQDSLRLLHAKWAEKLPLTSWKGSSKQSMFIIEDSQIRNFYGPKIGTISYSHWWPINKVDETLSSTLGALPGVTDCTVDLLKIDCLIRVADAMHLDQRRAPSFEYALTQPSGIAENHWKFQERMAKPYVLGDALVYTAQPPFEVESADAWWTAFDALQIVDRELRNVDRVLRDKKKTPLIVRRVDGAFSPTDLARKIETVGWTPVDSTIKVTDVPKIVSTLGGSKLYGNDANAPIREIIQNGLDAITARRRLQARPSTWGELKIFIDTRGEDFWLCFEDNGVGMSTLVLTGPLIDFGNSFWKSSMALEEFPGLSAAGMKPRGKYGIGFFSVFMLGDHVRVISRRYDRELGSTKILEFRHGLGSRPNLTDADPRFSPIDGGTRIEVKLNRHPKQPEGILARKLPLAGYVLKLSELISEIAPATDVNIQVTQEGESTQIIEAGDWLTIHPTALRSRISGENSKKTSQTQLWEELVELRDEEGRIYGRARIDTSNSWNRLGLIAVDGLSACKIDLIDGILSGLDTTASRNAAKPTVPQPVLASWATEQASRISKATIPDHEKARAAAIALACGGDQLDLPIARLKEKWLSAHLLLRRLKKMNKVMLHIGDIDHEDDDDVTKHDFEMHFAPHRDIFWTTDNVIGHKTDHWILSITNGVERSPTRIIEGLIAKAWGGLENIKDDFDTTIVGDVIGVDIYRTVEIYTRIDP